ncbi:hypothetical protein PIB30_064712 [Stylosanthes scabra]|uniref:Cytochrome P450 n=1 Tax=Stylosanthes scabra TaxID=79078 RepID=A0ABU6SLW2_9FABA|nr:hypothetical protein [Stylosanthes scabra]
MIATSNNIVSRCALGRKYDIPDGSHHESFGELGRKLLGQLIEFCVDSFLNGVIEEHNKKKNNDDDNSNKDFVDILLHLQEKGMLEFELTQADLKALLKDMIVGGTDTTSTTLEWTFAELLKKPNIMKKVQEEIRRIVGNKSKVDESDINQMNYLKCVLKESLRLHPPLPILLARQTTSNSKIKGYDIPSKTTVYLNAWAIHRDLELSENSLSENPEEFIPERFESILIDYKGQDFQLLSFGTGRRSCIGISFELASIEIILANLLYWFDWKLPFENGEVVQDINMSEMSGITVSKKSSTSSSSHIIFSLI